MRNDQTNAKQTLNSDVLTENKTIKKQKDYVADSTTLWDSGNPYQYQINAISIAITFVENPALTFENCLINYLKRHKF